MPASMSEYLEADLACEDLLECVYGLGDLAQASYRVLAASDEPLTVDAVAERVDRDRTTAYRAIKRLQEYGVVEQEQVNYEQGGYYFVYDAVDADDIAREMQRTLNQWYATVGTLIGEFEMKYEREDGDEEAYPDSVLKP
jgi:predicted transcriptional regulator